MPATAKAKAAKKTVTLQAKPKNKGGRPPKLQPDEETLNKVYNLGKLQCTTREAAAFLEVCHDTFLKFIDQYKKAREKFESGKETGKLSLRRMQLKSAEGGNVTMQIWLGKQLLDQKDKHEHGGDKENPIAHVHTVQRVIVDPNGASK